MFNIDDFTKNFDNMFSKSPSSYEEMIKNFSDYNTKFTKIAFNNIKKNVEVSQSWTKSTLNGLDTFTSSKTKPADYLKATTDYFTEQAQTTPKYLADFAEIAKKTQLDTVELFMEAGKEAKYEMSKTANKKTT